MSGRLTRRVLAVAVLTLGIVGVAAILIITRWGPGLFDWDSFNYLSAARSFAHGQGLLVPISATVQRPLIQFAPFFPVALSTLERLPVDLMVAARAFNALLFGLNLGLFACLAWLYTRSRSFTLAAAGLYLLTADLIRAHAWLLSEPLLMTLLLAGLLAFRLWELRRKNGWLVILYVCLSLAVMTKFAGAALAPAIAVLFILAEAPRPQKIKYIVMTFLSVLVPFLLWTYRTFTLTSTFNGFGLGYVPIQRGNLITAFITLFTWFLPDSWLFGRERLALVLVCIFLAVVTVYAFRARKDTDNAFTKVLAASGIFCSAYMFIVIFAKVFLDHGIGFRDRMLIPMFPFLLLSLVALLAHLAAQWSAWGGRVAAAGLVYMGLMLAADAAVALPPIYENGLGWNSRAIVTSAGIQELKGLAAENAVLYNNDIFGMYFHTGSVGQGLGSFPPEENAENSYVVIFKMHLHDEHALLEKYEDVLFPQVDDGVLSIHAYRP